MLKDTDKSVKEIAVTLDFLSISFSGKYCRRCFGCSPKVLLRRQLRMPAQ
ncbi:helix-turn-helix domain-containing protein [bacterium]|nr:helix-turn-helix domain-containing protein [bacterium]